MDGPPSKKQISRSDFQMLAQRAKALEVKVAELQKHSKNKIVYEVYPPGLSPSYSPCPPADEQDGNKTDEDF